jgi:hypothetical protein
LNEKIKLKDKIQKLSEIWSFSFKDHKNLKISKNFVTFIDYKLDDNELFNVISIVNDDEKNLEDEKEKNVEDEKNDFNEKNVEDEKEKEKNVEDEKEKNEKEEKEKNEKEKEEFLILRILRIPTKYIIQTIIGKNGQNINNLRNKYPDVYLYSTGK